MIRLMQMGQQRPKTPATDLAALTRQQREADRRLAQAVQPRRIEHWTQGANQIAQSALAGMDRRRLREKEEFTAKQGAELMSGLLGAGAGANPANLKAALLNPHTRDLAMKMMMQRQAQARAASQPSEYDRRAKAAQQYGLQEGTPAFQQFVLGGKLGGQGSKRDIREMNGRLYEVTPEGVKWLDGPPTPPQPEGAPAAGGLQPGQPGYEEYMKERARQSAKAEVKQATEGPKRAKAMQGRMEDVQKVVGWINQAERVLQENAPNWTGVTGTSGAIAGMVPGSQSYDFARLIDSIKANLGFEQLKEMRENSTSGASGLGQVTERELNFLQSVEGNLDTWQSEGRLGEALAEVKRILGKVAAGLQVELSGGMQSAPAGRPGFGVGEGQTMDLGNGITARRVR
jgi:hypothetical protein